MYLFGDGAGAVVLRGERRERADDSAPGILASYGGADYLQLVVREGGGALRPPLPGRACRSQHAFVVDGKLVAERFPGYMQRCMERRCGRIRPYDTRSSATTCTRPTSASSRGSRIRPTCPERLAMHMDHYGNTSAAGTLILLAEDLAEGVVQLGSGERCCLRRSGRASTTGRSLVRL